MEPKADYEKADASCQHSQGARYDIEIIPAPT